ncbi:MAG: N-acetyltransferase family protein [Armatimonadota bacterium]
MDQIDIRLAQIEGAGAINDIYNHYVLTSTCTFHLEPVSTQERLEWLAGHNDRYPVIVAVCKGQIVGWASLSPFRPRPAYAGTVESSVYVHHLHQRKGIGRLLMLDLISRAKALGYHSIIAGAEATQYGSIRLHEELGFEHVAQFKQVGFKFDTWLDTVFLQLML